MAASASIGWRRAADRMVQVEAALLPVALNGPFRHAAHGCDLGERETAEELQVDDLGEVRFDLRELVERIADQDQRAGVDDAVGVIGPSEVISNSPPRFSDRRRRTSSMINPRITRAA